MPTTGKSLAPASARDLNSLIDVIHTSASGQGDWAEALSRVQALYDARSVAVARYDFSTGRGAGCFQYPASSDVSAIYTGEQCSRNPWFMSSLDFQEACVVTGDELLTHKDFARTDYYQRSLKHHDLFHWLCGVMSRRNDIIHYLSIYRGRKQEGFTAADKKMLRAILEHVKIRLESHWALLRERSFVNLLGDVVERVGASVMAVDREGSVVFRNRGSEELFERHGGLELVEDRLVARRDSDDRTLREMFADLTACGASDPDQQARVVTLGDPRVAEPLVLSARFAGPFFCEDTNDYREVIVLVAKNPENGRRNRSSCAFASIYQLTPTQARVTELLLAGHNLGEVAQRLEVSDNTVRSHLKQIFLKTNTHGQLQLVQLHGRVCTDHF